MPKSVHRAGRHRAKALQPAQDQRPLLDRILDTPHIAHVVPRLQPELLHRVIEGCGLEDCGELVALATPEQLARVFDLDLWRTRQPGRDEHFDADRFGVWLEVLMESGATVAAQKLAAIDVDLVITALAQHLRVFDPATVSPSTTIDGEEVAPARTVDDGPDCEIGGYLVVVKSSDSWDAIVAVLIALATEHHDYFHRVMGACRRLSNSGREIDGLDDLLPDREQDMFDLAFDREQRREKQGYVTPAQARAFLQMARELRVGRDTTPPLRNPVARAHFEAIEWTTAADATIESGRLPAASGEPAPEVFADAVTAVVDVLVEAGVLLQPPRALLDAPRGDTPRLARIQAQMQLVCDRDRVAYSTRSQELGYIANTIMAGCSVMARPFTAHEASDAAVAVCNLGLENWPAHWLPADARRSSAGVDAGNALHDDFLVDYDLVTVFQVGWKVLHDDVCMYAAEQLVSVLTRLRCESRETQIGLDELRIEMARHSRAGAPWRAREALDVIAILDTPAWAALLGLIDECPVMHAAIGASRGSTTRAVSATAFEFISENRQIATVHDFMQSLPETLLR